MKNSPNVSVIIPTYKRKNKLGRAVESIRKQTYDGWELYIVNDAPDNDISEILPNDKRITYIQHKENKGAPAARNTGIQRSDAPFIALLDDDDTWKPKKLERQVERFKQLPDKYGLVYTGCDFIKGEQIVMQSRPDVTGHIFEKLLHKNHIPSPTPIIRRECFDKIGYFDTEFRSSQDYDMWLRIARSYKIDSITTPLATVYRGHEDRISANYGRQYQGKKRLIKKYREELEANPEALSRHLKHLGICSIYSGRPKEARGYFFESLRRYPRQPIVFVYCIVALMPTSIQRSIFLIRKYLIKMNYIKKP